MQAGLFARAGVRKVRLTGGEPTLRRDLVDLTAGIRSLPGIEAVGLTTNGLTLSRKLAALQAAGRTPPSPLLSCVCGVTCSVYSMRGNPFLV